MFTIAYDTLCTGMQPVNFDDQPARFATEAEALAEMDSDPEFYEDCSIIPYSEIGHKTIFTGKE